MSRKITASIMASVCGLAFAGLMAPAFAQSSSTSDTSGASGQATAAASSSETATAGDPGQEATRQAEQVGIKDVRTVEGAFVLQGVSPTARQIFLIVGPAGELLAVAAPVAAPAPAATQSGSDADQSGASTMSQTGSQTPAPVENPYRATQIRPATPAMWDPVAVERAMQSLELGLGGAAGEVPVK